MVPSPGLAGQLGKTPITAKSAPGFVANRILLPMINEAFFVLVEGYARADDIDQGMKLGCNHPIGPLALADLIGLDVLLSVMQILHDQFADSKYRPCPLLRETPGQEVRTRCVQLRLDLTMNGFEKGMETRA
jgi:3-hydroxybutyryl-CoA dehydrogenase